MEKMEGKNFDEIKEKDVSIVERILLKTNNPKLAAVLALDLLLVGVDTVSFSYSSHSQTKDEILDLDSRRLHALPVVAESRQAAETLRRTAAAFA